MDEFKRDLITVYEEFALSFTGGNVPDFDKVITILEKYGIEVSDELLVEDEE